MSINKIRSENFEWYTTQELAELLDVRPEWLRKNRKTKNPIPFKPFGRNKVRYSKQEVLQWIGRKDLPLRFYSTKSLSVILKVSEDWLRHNRLDNKNSIPHRSFGRLVRYNESEVNSWIKNKNSVDTTTLS